MPQPAEGQYQNNTTRLGQKSQALGIFRTAWIDRKQKASGTASEAFCFFIARKGLKPFDPI